VLIQLCVFLLLCAASEAKRSDWQEDEDGGDSSVQTAEGRTVLKLGVRHSINLTAIPDKLQPGSIFDERLLQQNQHLIWYQIPKWLAGKWQREQETTVFSYDYESRQSDRQKHRFTSRQTADFGVQKDKAGNIWHCNLASAGVSDRGSYRSIALVRLQEPLQVSADQLTLKEVFTVVNVAKETNVIMESYSLESLTRYKPISDGNVETSMSMKIYNADGSAKKLQENVAYDRRIGPMDVVDKYKGKDVRADFEQFLLEGNQGGPAP